MHSSKVISQLAARSLLALGLTLLCQVQLTWAQTSVADNPFQPLGAVFNLSERVVDSQARLIMFRPQGSTDSAGMTRINVNGAYHTSLMAGAYAVLCLAPGPVALDVRSVGAHQPASQQADMNTQIQLAAGQTVFLSASLQSNARYSLRPVEALPARESLKPLREQIHALSRVPGAQECKDPDAPVPAAPAAAPLPAEPIPTATR
jgi:OOP family OmpA-OmpF porin